MRSNLLRTIDEEYNGGGYGGTLGRRARDGESSPPPSQRRRSTQYNQWGSFEHDDDEVSASPRLG